MPLSKAVIEVLDPSPDRGLAGPIEVQFNPTEYTLAKGAQIAEIAIPGIDSPLLQFVRGQNEKLTLDLFFDTTDGGMDEEGSVRDVRELTRPVYQLVKIQPGTHAPPRVRFVWGGTVEHAGGLSFKAVVESVQQKLTLFTPRGTPVRATLSVSFREYKSLEEQLAELNLQSADHTKRRVVQPGDTLARVAAEEYGDPGRWRSIADANPQGVTNPRRLTPGTTLRIPPIEGTGAAAVETP